MTMTVGQPCQVQNVRGMCAVNEANPYQPPTAVDPPAPRRRFHVGPILSGLFAVVLATILVGPSGC